MSVRFVELNDRRLFLIHASAVGVARRRVLVLPPFAEELNKCRHLLAVTVRRLAAAGYDVLWPDLYGTGDSAGDFVDADWSMWCADLEALSAWHAAQRPATESCCLAVRSGALLLGALTARGRYTPTHTVLWQPLFDGARVLQQFLRLRVMAERMGGGHETVAELEQLLASDGHLEVAGYSLNTKLYAELGAARLRATDLVGVAALHLFEFKATGGADVTLPAREFRDALRAHGCAATARCVAAEQFWATQEISAPPAVVDATLAALG